MIKCRMLAIGELDTIREDLKSVHNETRLSSLAGKPRGPIDCLSVYFWKVRWFARGPGSH